MAEQDKSKLDNQPPPNNWFANLIRRVGEFFTSKSSITFEKIQDSDDITIGNYIIKIGSINIPLYVLIIIVTTLILLVILGTLIGISSFQILNFVSATPTPTLTPTQMEAGFSRGVEYFIAWLNTYKIDEMYYNTLVSRHSGEYAAYT
ncbi:MAG: hypothetical protein AAF639_34445, partial [Chloroflexota bacterium]